MMERQSAHPRAVAEAGDSFRRIFASDTAAMDEQQRWRGARGDHCICPAERKTACRHDPPVSLTEVEQQLCPRRLSACTDPDPGAVRKRSQPDGLGAAGVQSSSRRLDAAPRSSPKRNRHERRDRTKAPYLCRVRLSSVGLGLNG
jgi:hypothetical protein